jgi:hypothetical protein
VKGVGEMKIVPPRTVLQTSANENGESVRKAVELPADQNLGLKGVVKGGDPRTMQRLPAAVLPSDLGALELRLLRAVLDYPGVTITELIPYFGYRTRRRVQKAATSLIDMKLVRQKRIKLVRENRTGKIPNCKFLVNWSKALYITNRKQAKALVGGFKK